MLLKLGSVDSAYTGASWQTPATLDSSSPTAAARLNRGGPIFAGRLAEGLQRVGSSATQSAGIIIPELQSQLIASGYSGRASAPSMAASITTGPADGKITSLSPPPATATPAPAATQRARSSVSVDPRLQAVRVLAAEDDSMCRRVLGLLVRSAGFCLTSEVVADGLELTDKLAADTATVGVIVLDCNMARLPVQSYHFSPYYE